jgi:hypothetical protein
MKHLLLTLIFLTACGDNIDVFPDADERLRCADLSCDSPVFCTDPPENACLCFVEDAPDEWHEEGCAAPCAECDSGDLRCNPATGRCWCVALDGDVDACEP